ncbi:MULTISPECIES: alpha-ketoacid dehydrogenase subunit beta [unclassified Roseateles]|uniref:alpha-ketoacid dehydrogenase subunit beta n=1 Tax=unclassified Roseateles TaxID=2626991 RepID=UPI000700BFBB|nr:MULTISPECIES: transketolase C-terminal domain-containing protein [unclassified Roseateles]KQW52204.1 pyruvate dehydrogenase [Pelomonas sp. Root405]KRA78650.1 pyruvate dehydrogenase [Pelomonas sp. Root662]
MPTMTAQQALIAALHRAMAADERVIFLGEGVATKNPALLAAFGAERVRNTPLAEASIVGCAVGAAAMGLRPVVDLLFSPFLMLAMDALVNSAGKLGALSGGQFEFPLVVLAQTGAGWAIGGQHNHNLEALFVHVPGLQVLMPSTPADSAGLLTGALGQPRPSLLFSDIGLAHERGEVTGEELQLPGLAAVRRRGEALTLVGYGKTVHHCLTAAQTLQAEGVAAEVIDLRSLKPLDTMTLLASVRKTGRLLCVTEASGLCGLAAELCAVVAEQAFADLKAAPRRLTGPDAAALASWPLEQAAVPQPEQIAAHARALLQDRLSNTSSS